TASATVWVRPTCRGAVGCSRETLSIFRFRARSIAGLAVRGSLTDGQDGGVWVASISRRHAQEAAVLSRIASTGQDGPKINVHSPFCREPRAGSASWGCATAAVLHISILRKERAGGKGANHGRARARWSRRRTCAMDTDLAGRVVMVTGASG